MKQLEISFLTFLDNISWSSTEKHLIEAEQSWHLNQRFKSLAFIHIAFSSFFSSLFPFRVYYYTRHSSNALTVQKLTNIDNTTITASAPLSTPLAQTGRISHILAVLISVASVLAFVNSCFSATLAATELWKWRCQTYAQTWSRHQLRPSLNDSSYPSFCLRKRYSK